MRAVSGVISLRRSFFVSLVAHAVLVFLCIFLIQKRAADAPRRVTWIEVVPNPKTNVDSKSHQRIVQTTKQEKSDHAASDAFLGEQTQIVDRQTVSKNQMTVTGRETSHPQQKTTPSGGKLTEKKGGILSNLGVPLLPSAKQLEEMAQRKAEKDTPEWASPGANAPQDYIRGVKESERTALNTREYIFFGYYQRIRERLDRAWLPVLREKLVTFHRSGRNLASDMEHTTKVMVIINPVGSIVRVQVVGESGTQDLDDAAVKAFNLAGPFPNPPHGMIDGEGEIKIPWEFILRT